MRKIVIASTMMLVGACGSHESDKLTELQTRLDAVQAQLDDCDKAQTEYQRRDGEEAMSESDVAEAKDVDNVSQEQEWETRGDMAAEDGLRPSQENGWKDVTKTAGKTAKAQIPYQEQAAKQASDAATAACKDQLKNLGLAEKLKGEITAARGTV